MRRVETFVGVAGLLELIDDSPRLRPIEAERDGKRQRKQSDASVDSTDINMLLRDSPFLEAVKDDEFCLSPLIEAEPPIDLGSSVVTPTTSDVMANDCFDLSSPLCSSLITPETCDDVLSVLSDDDFQLPVALQPLSGGSCENASYVSSSETKPSRDKTGYAQWRERIRRGMRVADSTTRALLSPALASHDPHRTMDVLAQISPRQIAWLKPDEVRELVCQQLDRMREQMMRNLTARIDTRELPWL